MEETGLRPDQIKQVRGFADQQLRKPKQPDDASNRRISVIVQYLKPPESKPPEDGKKQIATAEKTSH
jgi:chemotaxis protein MotB